MLGRVRLWLAAATMVAVATPAVVTPAAAAPVSDADWQKIVAAAKHEGKIVISYFTDTGMEPVLRQFEKETGIRVEATPGRPDAVVPKILTEQQNGQYNWDLLLQPVNNVRLVLEPAQGLEVLPRMSRWTRSMFSTTASPISVSASRSIAPRSRPARCPIGPIC
jgi:hypothetical protein